MKLSEARKAFAALLAPIVLAVLMGISTGEWDFEVLATGVSGLVAALIVFYIPNQRQPGERD